MRDRDILIIASFFIIFLTCGCATSGAQQIQKKCKSVENTTDTFVCEQP